jgi:hypothetical protein
MRVYLLLILNALTNLYTLLFMWGFSAGAANTLPYVTLSAALCMFVITAPLSIFKPRLGVIFGLICAILLLPYEIAFLNDLLRDNEDVFITALFILPVLINMGTIILFTVALLQGRVNLINTPQKISSKIILAILPAFLVIAYIAFLYF